MRCGESSRGRGIRTGGRGARALVGRWRTRSSDVGSSEPSGRWLSSGVCSLSPHRGGTDAGVAVVVLAVAAAGVFVATNADALERILGLLGKNDAKTVN